MIPAFWLFFALVAWCYAGYPLAMLALARVRPRPTRTAPWTPSISVVLAVRNEADRIADRVSDLLAQAYPGDRLEVVVVCNGCHDGTEARARTLAADDPRLRVFVSPAAEGKAGALNLGVSRATGDLIVFADARQRFERPVLARLAARLADPRAGAVSGRLDIGEATAAAVEGVRRYWAIEVALRRAESRTGSVVGATGAIYAIRRELWEPLPPGLILDDVLTPMRIAMRGYRVLFADDAVAHDRASPSARGEFRRKVRTMVGNLELPRIEPRLLSPRANPLLGRYVSHKLLRLAAPLCLLGMLGTAAAAGGPFYGTLAVAQLAVYGLGAAGLLLRIPALGVPAGFVLAHAAVLAALGRPRRGAETVWSSSAR
ncbi:MAG: glycosyltransferase family 2 protein [Gemmatimonadota bacterium]|nr:glycosyltransferase family 2 protein [Gemmatimonadota bacterium]